MSEHNNEIQKVKEAQRKMMEITKEDEKFVKAICETFKCQQDEAVVRVQMMKKFTATHKNMGNARLNAVLDCIAEGSVIPTNTVAKYDYPVSAYLIMFDSEAQKKVNEKNCALAMNMRFDFMGKAFRVCIMREKDAIKRLGAFGDEQTGKALEDATKKADAADAAANRKED